MTEQSYTENLKIACYAETGGRKTLQIGTLIEALGESVLEIKRQFPGAAVTGIPRKPSPDWQRGDPMPPWEDDAS